MKHFHQQKLKTLSSFVLYTVILFSFTACFPRIDPRWNQIDDAIPVTPEIRKKACEYLRKRSTELSSLRTLSEVNLSSSEGLQSVRMSLVYQKANSIRIEILPPGAALALFLASSTEAGTLLLEPTKKLATKISDPQEMVARLLKIRIAPSDLAYILSARVPPRHLDKICPILDQDLKSSKVAFYYSIDGPGVTIFDPESGQYWTVIMQSGLLRTALLRRVTDDWPVLAADFVEDDFADPSSLYPRQINLVLGNQVLQARLEPSIVKFNSAVPAALFELKVPGGYRVEEK